MSRFRRRGDQHGDSARSEAREKLSTKVAEYVRQAEARSDVDAATELLQARGFEVVAPVEVEEAGGEVIDMRDRGSA